MTPTNFSDKEQILTEYRKRKQLNSMLGLEEQYNELVKWSKKTTAPQWIIKQAFENFKILAYHEWKRSFDEVDSKDDAPWRQEYC